MGHGGDSYSSFSSFGKSSSILAIQRSSTVAVLIGSTLAQYQFLPAADTFTTVVWIILLLGWDFKTRSLDPALMFSTLLKLAFPATVETSR